MRHNFYVNFHNKLFIVSKKSRKRALVSDSEDEDELQSKAKTSIGSDDEEVAPSLEPKEDDPEEGKTPAQEEYDSDEGVRNE